MLVLNVELLNVVIWNEMKWKCYYTSIMLLLMLYDGMGLLLLVDIVIWYIE